VSFQGICEGSFRTSKWKRAKHEAEKQVSYAQASSLKQRLFETVVAVRSIVVAVRSVVDGAVDQVKSAVLAITHAREDYAP
jgi:hypothetical protein